MEWLRRFISFILPPESWRMSVTIITGILMGIFILIIYLSNAPSYLSDKPETCINCHVMYPQYASWSHSSHARDATCVDCHVPQDNVFRKYYFKGSDGLRHSTYFTFRWEPQVIQIKSAGISVVQENCIRCHHDLVDMVSLVEVTGSKASMGEGKLCWDCHKETPHGKVRSLSAAPHALVPRLPSVIPAWMQQFFKEKENKK